MWGELSLVRVVFGASCLWDESSVIRCGAVRFGAVTVSETTISMTFFTSQDVTEKYNPQIHRISKDILLCTATTMQKNTPRIGMQIN